jgi:hypothetical protein
LEKNLSSRQNRSKLGEFRPHHFVTEFSFLIALLFFTSVNMLFAENKSDFQTSGSPFFPDLTLIMMISGSSFLILGVFSYLSIQRKKPPVMDSKSRITKSLGTTVAETIFQNGRIITVAAIVYGAIFAFLDGILIYQPSVNFAAAYGITSPAFVVEDCCGPPGYVPAGLAYFPAEHFGVQLIPASILIMLLVSILVGVNVAFLVTSIRSSQPMRDMQRSGNSASLNRTSFLGGAVGATFGVFAGCPTCAAAFFLSMIAGSGATAFSLTISEFQPVIILVSIPLLFGSILWQAKSLRKILAGCSV